MRLERHENSGVCSQPDLVYLFPFYIKGDGDPDERKIIEKHIETCAACRSEMRFFSDLQRVGEKILGDH